MVTVQHIVYLVARTEHHHVNDAQVRDKLLCELLVADVIVATQEVEVDAHLAESLLCVILCSVDRVDEVGITEMLASATDQFRRLAVPACSDLRQQPDFRLDAYILSHSLHVLQEELRQVGFFVQQDGPDDFHCLVVVWCSAVVEPQHAAQVLSLFAAYYPSGLADEAVARCVAHLNAEILRLATLAQDAVAVNPVVLDIVDIVTNQKQISSMDELPIADVRKEVWLRKGDIAFSVDHKFFI